MDALEKYYGTRTFTLYALFANVPGKKVWPRTIFLMLSVILLSFITFFQVLKLISEKFKFQLIIELLPTTFSTLGTLLYIPYVGCVINEEFEVLVSIMLKDLEEERSEEEDAIKRRYAQSARRFINTYSVVLIGTIFGLPLGGCIPFFLDLLLPLNESREMQLLADGEIFIDQKKYFYQIYFAQSCVVCVICIVIGISENMSVIIGCHLCGMFAVVGHRLQTITRIKKHELLDEVDYVRLMTHKLGLYIEDHTKSLEFGVLVAAFYDTPLALILGGSFCTLTVSLVQVTDPQLVNVRIIIYTSAQVFQLFLVSNIGQKVIDASEHLGLNAYNSQWNICPPDIRRLLQLVILRTSRPVEVLAKGLYKLSIENFMLVIKTVTSCYMMLRQVK